MKKFPRRTFLKGTGATLAGLGIGSVLGQAVPGLQDANQGRIRKVTVNSTFGAMVATIEYGRVTNVEPLAQQIGYNSNIQAMPDRLYNKARIRYPMVRRDFLAKREKSDRTQRGTGDFVRVSWDDAMQLVTDEMERVKSTYGNESLYTAKSSWGTNHAHLHRNEPMLQKLFNLYGGSPRFVGSYSTGALSVIMPRVAWSSSTAATDWPTFATNTQQIVLWGVDPLVNGRVMSIGYNTQQWTDLKGKGIPVVAIDPFFNNTARWLEADWVKVNSNTDVALALGVMHTLVSENLHDQGFLDSHTVGFDTFKGYLLGTSDGQAKDAGWAEAITGVPAAKIQDLARSMAAKRTMIVSGWSIQRQDHGEQGPWAFVTLAAMLGQIGLPGGGVSFGYHYSDGGMPAANMPRVPGFSSGKNPVSTIFPIARFVDVFENPGKQLDFNGTTITYPDIKLQFGLGGNMFTHHQDTNRLIRAYRTLETVIQGEPWWTPTTRFADIVLPAVSDFERNDIGQVGNVIVASHRAVDPIFESRSDYDTLSELADRLGVADGFNEGKDEMGWLQAFYGAAQQQAGSMSVAMPDFDTFWNGDGVLAFELGDGTQVHEADFRADPMANPLGTPSGMIEIFSQTIADLNYDDCPGHPAWMEPVEWVGSAKAADYPLALVSKHNMYRIHSQMDNTWLRDVYKVDDREPLFLNSKDAADRGIQTGDVVRVFNGRGQTLAGAVVTDDVREGAVVLHEGSWYDPAEPGKEGTLDKQGDANLLTLDEPLSSKLAQATIAHTALVQVERYTGTAPMVTAYEQPIG